MTNYIIEKTDEKSENKYVGDHHPEFLATIENAWHYPEKEATEIAKNLGENYQVKPLK